MPILEGLRARGFAGEELAVLERSARELSRVDALFSRYVGPRLANRLREEPDLARLGGREADVTVLFADLAGFTSFSEGRPASEVIVMVVFNALDDQPDHAVRAARSGLAMRERTQAVAADHLDWPRFRIGLNTGLAVVGNVGAGQQRSFSAIGDTTNVAARLQGVAEPGQVLMSAATLERVRDRVTVDPIGAIHLKGKDTPVEAFELLGVVDPV
jgi:class 3 adenylate cyclase